MVGSGGLRLMAAARPRPFLGDRGRAAEGAGVAHANIDGLDRADAGDRRREVRVRAERQLEHAPLPMTTCEKSPKIIEAAVSCSVEAAFEAVDVAVENVAFPDRAVGRGDLTRCLSRAATDGVVT